MSVIEKSISLSNNDPTLRLVLHTFIIVQANRQYFRKKVYVHMLHKKKHANVFA